MFSAKLNLLVNLIPSLFNGPEVLFFVLNKAKLFTETFSHSSDRDDSVISLPAFSSRINLTAHNIPATSEMVKKVVTDLDLSNAYFPDSIPVVPKDYEPEHWYILAELFNMCLKEFCFSDFQYGFRSTLSTADLPTVVSDRIDKTFIRCGAT